MYLIREQKYLEISGNCKGKSVLRKQRQYQANHETSTASIMSTIARIPYLLDARIYP
jgi:hypothetical protein